MADRAYIRKSLLRCPHIIMPVSGGGAPLYRLFHTRRAEGFLAANKIARRGRFFLLTWITAGIIRKKTKHE
jgi:hypothetical protein